MTAPLSTDLRQRLIAAVENGQSCRSAAKRFGGGSTAIKWVGRWRQDGLVDPKPLGGDRHSPRMEAHAEEILGLIFIDETGASTKMARLRGRALRGERCRTDTGKLPPSWVSSG